MVKKSQILNEFKHGKIQSEIAKEHNVSTAYISQVINNHLNKIKAQKFDFLKQLIEREAIEIKTEKMSDSEIKRLEEM